MKVVLFGIIQGITEFLPISSSGHLYIFKRLTGIQENLLSFFIFLHLATLIAILVFFRRQIKGVITQKRILLHLGVITVISGALGLTANRFLTDFFDYKYVISSCLLVNGLILLSVKNTSPRRDLTTLTIKDSFILGLLQGAAVMPGISRSGITISGLLKRGFSAAEAFTLSFLMAVPVIIGAFLLDVGELIAADIPCLPMTGGFMAAFLCGLLALKILKTSLVKIKFRNFGYYCLIASFLTLFL